MGLTGAAGPGAVDVFGDSNCSIIDGEKTDSGDRMLFGFCDFGDWQCAELGYVLLIQVAPLVLDAARF